MCLYLSLNERAVADDDNVYHIYRKKKVPDLLILLVMMNKISESI